jgi:phage terminase small subunit
MALTPKQEAFCLAYLETGNASEAYRKAYDAGSMKPATVNRAAKELLDHPKISARLEELRKKAAARNAVTVDDLLEELDEARMIALAAKTPQTSAAVAASMGKAKLLGLDITKTELTGKNGKPLFGGDPKELTDEQLAHIATAGGAGTAD